MNDLPEWVSVIGKSVCILGGVFAATVILRSCYISFFGRFGYFTSEFALIHIETIDQCPVFLLAWRKKGDRTEDDLARAYKAARLADAEEDMMMDMKDSEGLPSGLVISARIGPKRFIIIDTQRRAPHDRSITSFRTFDKYSVFATIDVECAKSKGHPMLLSASKALYATGTGD